MLHGYYGHYMRQNPNFKLNLQRRQFLGAGIDSMKFCVALMNFLDGIVVRDMIRFLRRLKTVTIE